MNEKGKVYLVGAGPGSADLITVRGAELLKTADCIIYDKLANPALLKFARPAAELIHVPKRIGPGSATQDQINNLLVEKANLGLTVVRLKGGDPGIFGRIGEELSALKEAGIDFEIVPGVTAAVAAAESAGIILTDRDYSSQVVFITGREAQGKQKSSINWELLAKFQGTIVFYMAMENLELIAERLIKNGMAEGTPVAVIAEATLPSQRTVRASLKQITEKCEENKIAPPAIVVIGAAADEKLNWLVGKPFFGKTIVITRDAESNVDFAAKIISKGGNPVEFATIKIEPLTQTNIFLQTLTKFSEYDWFIFTSANGASVLFDALQQLGKDARVFASAKIAAIGSETAAKLQQFGIKADFTPSVFTSKELGKQLIAYANLKAKKILLLRSQLASDELSELLSIAGAEVDNVPVYTTAAVKNDPGPVIEKIKNGEIDWLTFTSPSSTRAFFEQIPVELVNSSSVKIASIGPVTSEQLKNLGFEVNVHADEHTADGLLAAIEKIYNL
ncbi:MAG: uroporphyrinogen-III C-methyltransferase [Phycisphaerae bacterium]|nr:uroporphyrinogen-III C-methyltransferase [Phycisphaerae bacterium]